MQVIGCDLRARQQAVAVLDTTKGEVVKVNVKHEGHKVREFYSALPRPVRVGIEATGSMQWFVNLMALSGDLVTYERTVRPAGLIAAGRHAIASLPLSPDAAYRRGRDQLGTLRLLTP